MAVPARPNTTSDGRRMRRRPYVSASIPTTRMSATWGRVKAVMTSPMAASETPSAAAMSGSAGATALPPKTPTPLMTVSESIRGSASRLV